MGKMIGINNHKNKTWLQTTKSVINTTSIPLGQNLQINNCYTVYAKYKNDALHALLKIAVICTTYKTTKHTSSLYSTVVTNKTRTKLITFAVPERGEHMERQYSNVDIKLN